MKIAADSIQLSASHLSTSSHTVRESLRAWVGDKRPDFEGRASTSASPAPLASAFASLSAEGLNAARVASEPAASGQAQAIEDAADAAERDPLLNLLKAMVEMMTGRQIRVTSSDDFRTTGQPVDTTAANEASQAAQAPQRAGFGLEYDRHEVVDESEQTNFQASGKVRTSDGKEIDFTLTLAMSRSFHQESDVSIRQGDGVRKDPLAINFDGTAAQLQSQRFQFDIDGDGKTENVPMLSGDKGYLALDLNGNGSIDSGKELFGAASGDGFAELARHDSDGNGWIDDNDPVFQQLRVWTPGADGKGSLGLLKERGVGALYLGHADTPFALKNEANQTLGAVRASGAYLTENGRVGSLQQIDLMV